MVSFQGRHSFNSCAQTPFLPLQALAERLDHFDRVADVALGDLCTMSAMLNPNYTVPAMFPKQCGNTWGSYGNGKKPGWLDRGGGRAVCGIHRYFPGFVLACSFRL